MNNADAVVPEAGLIDLAMKAAEVDDLLDDDCRMSLLEALTGDGEPRSDRPEADESTSVNADPSTGCYLRQITVAGFRGVGPESTLPLTPGPGLVIVAGRNGSGKSTFSEALEVALTGASYRWEKKSAQWRDGWRNLHSADPCEIRVELVDDEGTAATLGVDWSADAGLNDSMRWAQLHGQKRDRSADPFGWATPLQLYRPVLSYEELGGILEAEPKELYERLSAVLGLGPVADAQVRLDDQLKELRAPGRDADKAVKAVKAALAESADTRARRAEELLSPRERDLDALEKLAHGALQPDGDLSSLRMLGSLDIPSVEQARAAVGKLRTAVADLAEAATKIDEGTGRREELLRHALGHMEAEGPGKCPLCGMGELDEDWQRRTRLAVDELRGVTAAVRDARSAREAAERQLRGLLPPLPAPLISPTEPDLSSRSEAADAWRALAEADLGDAGDTWFATYERLKEVLQRLREEAATEVTRRDDDWAPIAKQVGETVAALRHSAEVDAQRRTTETTAKWLKAHAAQLRQQRMAPIVDQVKHIWQTLRHDSNVDLGDIELIRSGNRRRVEMSAEVDGCQVDSALAVMSQGELHSLALALFLPRATLADSPFRFVVVDDPVQAMDPSKVDGLARALDEIARTRQVVVFSHDNRLPQAVRDLGIEARIVRVDRSEGSEVTVREESDPATRFLREAEMIARDSSAGAAAKARAVPLLCRMAVEAACRDVLGRQRVGTMSRAEMEDRWEMAKKTGQKVALVVHGDHSARLDDWLGKREYRRRALGAVGPGVHEGSATNALNVVENCQRMVDDIQAGRK